MRLYWGAMQRLVNKAHEERAKFPLDVAVTNGDGEAWSAVVTLKDGGEFNCKHRPGVAHVPAADGQPPTRGTTSWRRWTWRWPTRRATDVLPITEHFLKSEYLHA
jgi:hypothetical protein